MYRLVRFGTTNIEYSNQVEPVGSGPTPTAYYNMPDGGAVDSFGSARKSPGAFEIVKSTRLVGGSEADLEAKYFQLLALAGTRDKLYRRTSQGDIHWMYARLAEVAAQRSYEQARFRLIQDVDLRFIRQEAVWHGTWSGSWLLDSGIYLDTGYDLDSGDVISLDTNAKTFTIAVGSASDPGRAPARSMQIQVHANIFAITGLTIARTGGEAISYTGTIPSSGTLTIDTGSMQVQCTDDAGAYNHLVIAPTADLASWFTLLPGDNEITVTRTGGDPTASIQFMYYEAWY